jgi:hypothetical protein
MTFAGIPVGVLIAVLGGGFLLRNAWKEWRQDRANIKSVQEASRAFKAEHEWKPHMVNGSARTVARSV